MINGVSSENDDAVSGQRTDVVLPCRNSGYFGAFYSTTGRTDGVEMRRPSRSVAQRAARIGFQFADQIAKKPVLRQRALVDQSRGLFWGGLGLAC